MPEVTDEQMAKLEKAERDDARRRESNRKRTKAISQLVDAHKDEYKQFYDAAGANRKRAMKGILYSGRAVSDPRSRNRKQF